MITTEQSADQALYRFFDASGTLLYVGITANVGARWKAHSKERPWWAEVASATVEHYPDRTSVEEAERRAICDEHPRYNVLHNGDGYVPRPRVHRPPARRRGFGRIERRNSGRYRAAFTDDDGRLHRAPHTFASEAEAEDWVSTQRRLIELARRYAERQITRDEWLVARRDLVGAWHRYTDEEWNVMADTALAEEAAKTQEGIA